MASKYENRKARMARDPEYRTRVLQTQANSRRARRERQWQEHVEGLKAVGLEACPVMFPGGRRCWRTDAHQHAAIDAINAEPVPGPAPEGGPGVDVNPVWEDYQRGGPPEDPTQGD